MADLASADEIQDFPGAPFAADVLTAAGETVRAIAGWHIAPSETDTVTLDSDGGAWLFLPTLHLTAVVSVTDVRDPDNPVALSGVVPKENGTLYLRCGFPCGVQAVEIEFTHGYAACPPELLPIVAAAARTQGDSRLTSQKSIGSGSISYESSSAATSGQKVLDKYTITDV